MEQQPKRTETQPQSLSLDSLNASKADLTKICWTQLLRETELADVQPLPLPLPPPPDDSLVLKLLS